MGKLKPPVLTSSRICDASRVAIAADDTPVKKQNWENEFILCTQIEDDGNAWSAAYKLRFRDKTAAGAFADVGSATAIRWGTGTVLVDGATLTQANSRCTNNPGSIWQDGLENEGDNLLPDTGTYALGGANYTEFQWALDPTGVILCHEYEFELYDVTNGAAIGTCVATWSSFILHYVNTGSTPGGTGKTNATTGTDRAFASTSEWEAAADEDLVAAGCGNSQLYLDGGQEEYKTSTGAIVISGWNTDQDNKIEILGGYPLGNGRHDNTFKTDRHRYRWTVDTTTAPPNGLFDIELALDDAVEFSFMQVEFNITANFGANTVRVIDQFNNDELGFFWYHNNLVKGDFDTSPGYGDVIPQRHLNLTHIVTGPSGQSAAKAYIYNNIIYLPNQDSIGRNGGGFYFYANDTGLEVWCYYNTVIGGTYGIVVFAVNSLATDLQVHLKNNLVAYQYLGALNEVNPNGVATDSDYNTTDDSSFSGGANDKVNQTFDFENESAKNYRLTCYDRGAQYSAVDVSADTNLPVDDDGKEETRSIYPDCGADEEHHLCVTFEDTVGITDVLTRILNAVRSIADTVGITDLLTYIYTPGGVAYQRSIFNTVGITDTVARKKGAIRSIADNVGITDTVNRIGSFFRTIADNVGITDTVNRIGSFFRTITDTVGSTDLLARSLVYFRSIADTVGITDTVATVKGAFRSIADTVGITDLLARSKGAIRSISDTVGITDTLNRIGSFFRSIADTVGSTDLLAASKMVFVSLADTVGITDLITTAKGAVRSIADTVNITDTLTRIASFFRSVSDTVGITDTVARIGTFFRTITDTENITDTLAAITKLVRSISDTVGITDTITRVGTFFRTITDTENITDTLTRIGSFFRTVADTVGITDVLTAVKVGAAKFASLADTVGITDTITTARNIIKSISDTVGITDVLTAAKKVFVSLADTVGITDIITRSKGAVRSITDTVNITDTLTKIVSFVRSITDTVNITDTLTRIGTFFRTITDTENITDALTVTKKILVSLADTVGITDILTRSKKGVRIVADTVGITDLITRSKGAVRSIIDTVNISDTISTIRTIIVQLADTVGITDVLNAFVSLPPKIFEGISNIVTFTSAGISTISKSIIEFISNIFTKYDGGDSEL